MDYEAFKARVNNFLYYAYIASERNRGLFGSDPLVRRCAFFRVKHGLPYRYTEHETRVMVRKLGDTGFWGFYHHWRNWRLAWRIGEDEVVCAEKYKENFHWREAARLYKHLRVRWWDVNLCLRILFFPEYVSDLGAGTMMGVLRVLEVGSKIQAPVSYLPVPLKRERVATLPSFLRDI